MSAKKVPTVRLLLYFSWGILSLGVLWGMALAWKGDFALFSIVRGCLSVFAGALGALLLRVLGNINQMFFDQNNKFNEILGEQRTAHLMSVEQSHRLNNYNESSFNQNRASHELMMDHMRQAYELIADQIRKLQEISSSQVQQSQEMISEQRKTNELSVENRKVNELIVLQVRQSNEMIAEQIQQVKTLIAEQIRQLNVLIGDYGESNKLSVDQNIKSHELIIEQKRTNGLINDQLTIQLNQLKQLKEHQHCLSSLTNMENTMVLLNCDSKEMVQSLDQIRHFFQQIQTHLNLKT